MYEVFGMILGIEQWWSRYASENVLTNEEIRRIVGAAIDDVVEVLTIPSILLECGWGRVASQYETETAYSMRWTDEPYTRALAYSTTIGEPFRRRKRKSDVPLFHEYELMVRQVSLQSGEVSCCMVLSVYAQYRNGARIQVRHIELMDRFPLAIRSAVIDDNPIPDDMSMDDYPYVSLLVLFETVMDRVVCERR
jgi:hypothetical protein